MAYDGAFAWFDSERGLVESRAARPTQRRFPDGAAGALEWNELVSFAQRRAREGVLSQFGKLLETAPEPKLRLFISHRQSDVEYARSIARLAVKCGFEYWLDVEDPALPGLMTMPDNELRSILIAAIIEIGLLNSSHVIALITPNALSYSGSSPTQRGPSLWIPYEYGRVKAKTLVSHQAAAWIHHEHAGKALPEYLYLGVRCTSESQIEDWLLGTGGRLLETSAMFVRESSDPVIKGAGHLP